MAYNAEQALVLIRERIQTHERENPTGCFEIEQHYFKEQMNAYAFEAEEIESDICELRAKLRDAKERQKEYAEELRDLEEPKAEQIAEWNAEMARLRGEERRHERYLSALPAA